jgi:hypothetical protein
MPSIADLGQRVKAKYPGTYDDLDDAELGRRVQTKYPDAYADFTDDAAAAEPPSRDVPLHETALAHGANGFGLGAGPKARGLYAAGPAEAEKSGRAMDPLTTVADVAVGAWRKLTGDPEAAKRYEAEKAAEKAYLEETRAANPKTAFVSNVVGAAPTAAAVAGLAPVVKGATLLPRVVTGVSQGATVGLASGLASGENAGDVTESTLIGAGSGCVVPVLGAGASKVTAPVREFVSRKMDDAAGGLRRFAGERNIKAAGGIQSDITRARKQLGPGGASDGRAALTEIGAEMGDKGLVSSLSTPAKTFERAAELMDDAGSRMGAVLAEADAAGGAQPTVAGVLAQGDEILSALQKNPHTASAGDPAMGHSMGNSAADQFSGLLARYRRIYGDRPLTFSEAHEIRMNISKDLYGMRGTKDPWADAYKDALHDFRSAVSSEIEQNLDAATSNTAAWRAANRDYQVASKALEFADKGMDRATGNNFVSPTEFIAGMTGAGIGSAHGGAGMTLGGLALAGGTAFARRHGSGTMGSVAGTLSRILRTNPEALGAHAKSLLTMEAQRGPEGLAAAHYVLSQTSPDYRMRWQAAVGEGEETE